MHENPVRVARKGHCRAVFPVFLLLLWPGALSAGVNVWTANGPPGRSVHAVAVDPSDPLTVYAGTEGGVFRSRDGGKTWRQAGLVGEIVRVLMVASASPSVVYAGVYFNKGVVRSTDGGATWSLSGLDGLNVVAFAVSPDTPSTVYASYYESPFGDGPGGLARSQDSGVSWTTLLETAGVRRTRSGSTRPSRRRSTRS